MNEYGQQLPTEARIALQNYFAKIRLARATELAQTGRFPEAEAILMPNGEYPDAPQELDLLARIAARQGRFDQARRFWSKAIQEQPENEVFRQCMDGLTLPRRIFRIFVMSLDTLLNILACAAIAFAIGTLVFKIFFK